MSMWTQLGDGVFCRRYEFLALSIGAVIGDDGVLVIDTRCSHEEAQELIADLAGLTALPARWVVNTHWHWDHCWGNAPFGSVERWGHVNTRRALIEDGEAIRREVEDWFPMARRHEVREVEIVPPDRTFSEQVSLDIGRPVELRYDGRGHTDGDITVEAGEVLFAGDLVEESAPPSFGDAFPLDWVPTLDRIIDRITGPVVPGHGDPVDRTFVESQRTSIATAVELARAAHLEQVSLDSVDLRASPFPEAVTRTVVARTYAQLAGLLD